ncbi:MAG TPA: aldehyde dehydrogenase [Planctomycetes bacterium]|nr:aldehyde dehydrogenase [Planctomycetota bacterium]
MSDPKPLFLAGEWVRTPSTRAVVAPGTGESLGEVCLAGPDEVERAAQAAFEARPLVAGLRHGERADLLHALADAVERERDLLAGTICDEAGKPLPLAEGEVSRALQTLRIGAEEATRVHGELLPLDRTEKGAGRTALVRRAPIGAVLGITPFNFPLNLALHKLAPALAAGCPVVLKAADQTPLILLELARLFAGIGAPAGALSVLNAEVAQSETLVRDERFALLSFTGSPKVGYLLKSICGRKKVLLELGGNAGVYVDQGADLQRAAERVAFGALAYSGQVCISVQRIYVHQAVYADFRALLLERFQATRTGAPREEGVTVAPLIDEAAAQRVLSLVERARAAGAEVLCGGTRDGASVAPTLLENVPDDADASREEAFGPLACLCSVRDAEEGFARLDDSPFGLQAGVFSDDVQVLLRAHERLEVGGIIHDDVPTWRVDEMPYGGVKQSGLGREGLRDSIREMTEPRLLVLRQR